VRRPTWASANEARRISQLLYLAKRSKITYFVARGSGRDPDFALLPPGVANPGRIAIPAPLRYNVTCARWARPDRLGRNTRDVLNLVHEIEQKGGDLRVLEPAIDTSGPMGKMVLTVLGMVAIDEFLPLSKEILQVLEREDCLVPVML
jgi:Resolvase, N terminal domain